MNMNVLTDPKFFVAVSTVLFFAITFKHIKKAFLNILDTRIEKIKTDLEAASKLRIEATELLKQAEAKLAQSETEAEMMISHARKEAESIVANANAKISKDIEVRKNLAMQKIQAIEEAAVVELKRNLSKIATDAAVKVIVDSSDENNSKKLFDKSLERLSKAIH